MMRDIQAFIFFIIVLAFGTLFKVTSFSISRFPKSIIHPSRQKTTLLSQQLTTNDLIHKNLQIVRNHVHYLEQQLQEVRNQIVEDESDNSLQLIVGVESKHVLSTPNNGKLVEELQKAQHEAATVVTGFETLLKIDKDIMIVEDCLQNKDIKLRQTAEKYHSSMKEARDSIANELMNYMIDLNQIYAKCAT